MIHMMLDAKEYFVNYYIKACQLAFREERVELKVSRWWDKIVKLLVNIPIHEPLLRKQPYFDDLRHARISQLCDKVTYLSITT